MIMCPDIAFAMRLCSPPPAVNPYVASALAAASQHGPQFAVAAFRQPGCAVSSSGTSLGGISSFAFQGTNAHALIGKHLSASGFHLPDPTAARLAAGDLQRARFWVFPAAHPLVGTAATHSSSRRGGPKVVVFECQLLAPRLALYAHHAVFGRVLFPAAGMLEAVLAAGATALDAAAAQTLAVEGMAISSPLVLPPPNSQQKRGIVIRCTLEPATGDFTLSHAAHRTSKKITENAAGTFALVTATVAAVAVHTAAAVALRAAALRHALLCKTAQLVMGHTTGSITVHQQLATDGYRVPPTCMDACLHLGVAALGCGAKVPVAVGAFAATARTVTGIMAAELSGSTSANHRAPTGSSDVSSFGLRTTCGAGFASLSHLETKVMKPKASPGSAGPAGLQAADYLYEVDWEAASEPQPASSKVSAASTTVVASGSRSSGAQHAVVSLIGSSQLPISLSLQLTDAPHLAAMALLSVVQAGTPDALAASVPEVLPYGLAGSGSRAAGLLAAGAMEGLLRVAASEQAHAAYALAAADKAAAAAGGWPALHADASDSKGTLSASRQRGRVDTAPRLLRSAAQAPAAELVQILPMPRGSLASLVSQTLAPAAVKLREGEVLVSVKAIGINFRQDGLCLDLGPVGMVCRCVVLAHCPVSRCS